MEVREKADDRKQREEEECVKRRRDETEKALSHGTRLLIEL